MKRVMRRGAFKSALMVSCMPLAVITASQSWAAQSKGTEKPASPDMEEVVVTGEVVTRNRTSSVSPELVYDTEFFQKFEPISAGDMMKRVPGVAFTSDIGEYDSPQMRGMADGFTQILVNGRPLPGAGNDRTVFVDRIPAELIDRIEVIRSPGADIDSQGVGGTINIILKDGANLPEGGSARLGGIYYAADDKFRGSGALTYSGRANDDRIAYSMAVNVQSRYNAKKMVEETILAELNPGLVDGREVFSPDDITQSKASEYSVQRDQRKNLDIALNSDVTFQIGDEGALRLDGFYVNTDRTEREDTALYEVDDDDLPTSASNPLLEDEKRTEDTDTDLKNFGIGLLYEDKLSDSLSMDFTLNYSQFDSTEAKFGKRFDFVETLTDADEKLDKRELETEKSLDKEYAGSFSLEKELDSFSIKAGFAGKIKKRNFSNQLEESDDNGVLAVEAFSDFFIKETRADGFLVGQWDVTSGVTFEAGVRMEHTSTHQEFVDLGGNDAATSAKSTLLNPSAHLQADVGDNGQVRVSVARTVRRPTFDQLVPSVLTDEPEDDDAVRGNPDLKFEKSWGLDVGYEHVLPGKGIMGVNFFYRKVKDLNQLVNTNSTITVGGDDFNLYQYRNVGDGKTWGIEFDISTTLAFIDLEETGFFANFTRIWSDRFDENAQMDVRFNHQPKFVYNVGLTQNIPDYEVTFGASYQKQGLARSVFLGEIEDQWYDGNLEVFIEKRFEGGFTLRLTGNNLLNAESIQAERNFDGDTAAEVLANQRSGTIDNYELERETASRIFMITGRYSF